MKNRSFIFIIYLVFVLSIISCYRVNDSRTLILNFEKSKLSSSFLKEYIDTVLNKKLTIPQDIMNEFFKGNTMNENERLVHFVSDPEEWYLIGFEESPCRIIYIYNRGISADVIYMNETLQENEIKRIKTRMENELFKKAIEYGIQKHLPDSIIYTKYSIDSSLVK